MTYESAEKREEMASYQAISVMSLDDANNMHKYAFRKAFELLIEMWPPINTDAYFYVAVQKFNAMYQEAEKQNNQLLKILLIEILGYLGNVANQQQVSGDVQ